MKKVNRNKIYVFTATTTNQRLFGENPQRKAFAVYNNGANMVEFLDNPNGSYGAGYPLSPTNEANDKNFNPQGELYVIATTGNTELRVWEILSEE